MLTVVIVMGIVLVATTAQHVQLASLFVKRIHEIERNCPEITVFIDAATGPTLIEGAKVAYIDKPSYSWGDKIAAIQASPYEDTIYLDVDMLPLQPFIQDLSSLFSLGGFTLSALPGMGFNEYWESTLYPKSIPQLNTGVIVIRMSKTSKFISTWRNYYHSFSAYGDQEAFRASLLDTLTSMTPLAPEFNCLPDCFVNQMPSLLHMTGARNKHVLLDDEQCKILINKIHEVFSNADTIGALLLNHRPVLVYSAIAGGWTNQNNATNRTDK